VQHHRITDSQNTLPQTHRLTTKKGLLLAGGIGCGKTTIMRAFASNPLCSYKVIPARTISFQFAEHGFPIISCYANAETTPPNSYGQTALGICFDDLGTEEERKHYGDKINAMAELLLSRYDSIPFNQTHITTNLNAQMIEQTYGPRIRSRMREMFNLIHFPQSAPDRR
jgi:DNA replication protein DnaC